MEAKSPWLKFINNDGIPVGEYGPAANWPTHVKEFQQKAESFSHWSYQKFKGKAFVCDLQGLVKHISATLTVILVLLKTMWY